MHPPCCITPQTRGRRWAADILTHQYFFNPSYLHSNITIIFPYFLTSLSYKAVSNKGTVKNNAIYHDEPRTMANSRISALKKIINKMIRLLTDEFLVFMA